MPILFSKKFGLVEAFILFTFLTFVISLAWDYHAARSSAEKMARLLFEQHSEHVSAELSRIQAPVGLIAFLGRSLSSKGSLSFTDDWERVNKIFMPVMKSYPFITSINYGNDKGDGYLILNTEGVWTNRIKRASEPGLVTWITLDEEGGVRNVSKKKDDYDPRLRPWYSAATDTLQWTAPYVFRTTKDIGVTASCRISSSEVMGIDVMLKDISNILERMGAEGEELLVIDSAGFLWGSSDINGFNARLAASMGAAPMVTDKGLEKIYNLLRQGISHADEKAHAAYSVQRVMLGGSRDIFLVSTGLRNRHIQEFLRLAMTKTPFILGLFVVFAVFFTIRYLLPLRRLTAAIHGYRSSGKSSLLPLDRADEIGRLASEFSILTHEVEERRISLVQSEHEYRRLSNQFHALLDAIPDNLTLIDRDFKILWANIGAAAGLGMKPEEIVGRHCYELWHKRATACDACPVADAFETGMPGNMIVTTPDGRMWDLRTVPLKDERGEVSNVIEVGRDVTEHKKLEEQLRHAQKMEAVGQLAGGVAHDFNNILTAIIGYGHLAMNTISKDDPLRHHISQILDASQRAASLTQSLLAFGRKQTMNLITFDLADHIKRFQKLLRRLLREDIDLDLEVLPGAADRPGVAVLADQGQIEQVLMNLVTNARDAMPNGGKITISLSTIELDENFVSMHGYGRPGWYALISVTDTGIGMDEAVKQRIFEPFFTTKEQGKGTGLGLSMVYGIVKKHEGFINVYSEPGKGAMFKIYLPLTQGPIEPDPGTGRAAPDDLVGGSETILVAEDDAALLELTAAILEGIGYTVIRARDGEDAVEKFSANIGRVHLVVLDGIMPKKNGMEAFIEIKALQPGIKALFMSGYAEDVFTKNGIPLNETLFLQKPVSPKELASRIRATLDV